MMAHRATLKSKDRVVKHGEVFTNDREVNAMLDLVRHETERIDSRFLEPACGTGNFLTEVLSRKLSVVKKRYSRNQLEFEKYATVAVSSLYGVDILEDNVKECRGELLNVFSEMYERIYRGKCKEDCLKTVKYILSRNILWRDTLSLTVPNGGNEPIVFSEWSPVNGSMMKRRDFTMASLLTGSPPPGSIGHLGSLNFDNLRPTPIEDFPTTHFLKIGEVFA